MEGGDAVVLESHNWVYGPGVQGVDDHPKLEPLRAFAYPVLHPFGG